MAQKESSSRLILLFLCSLRGRSWPPPPPHVAFAQPPSPAQPSFSAWALEPLVPPEQENEDPSLRGKQDFFKLYPKVLA
jgi:hypothetical protein